MKVESLIDAFGYEPPKLVIHDTIAEIEAAYSATTAGCEQCGHDNERARREEIEAHEEEGFWGFADLNSYSIHVWVSATNTPPLENLIFFLGHELGHLTKNEYEGDEFELEECRADEFGAVAAQAATWAIPLHAAIVSGMNRQQRRHRQRLVI